MKKTYGLPRVILILFIFISPVVKANTETLHSEPISPLSTVIDKRHDKSILGGLLFYDKRLSKDNTIACASCHDLQKGGADGFERSIGINGARGDINTPSVFNSGFNFRQFWNGRVKTLEEQVDGPVQHFKEMGSDWNDVVNKLSSDKKMKTNFEKIYPTGITSTNIKNAIAHFERQLVTVNSTFDRFLLGDQEALSAIEKTGYERFKTFGCIACHQGTNVGGNMFQTMGVMGNYFKDRNTLITDADLGRFVITKDEKDKHLFRVPSLRNVAQTAPYFHDGSAKTLDRAIEIMAKYQLGRKLSKEEIDSIVAFLKTLSGATPRIVEEVLKEISP